MQGNLLSIVNTVNPRENGFGGNVFAEGGMMDESLVKRRADLISELSFELRTPLNTILGFASLLKDPMLNSNDRNQYVDRIVSNGDYLLQILDDALNYSKIQKGEATTEKVNFSIVDMVYDIAETLRKTTEKKGIHVYIKYKNPIPQTIFSDPLKIRQILANIIGNTIRYAQGDGFIFVSLDYDKIKERIIIEVDDSALQAVGAKSAGIADQLTRIESLFYKDILKRPGFTLSQEFAKILGGSLEIQKSPIGEGKNFQLNIPSGNKNEVPFVTGKKSASLMEKISNRLNKLHRLENVKVLVAEDSPDNEMLIRLFLSKEGARLTYAHNGLEAIDAVQKQDIDVILMDIQMPLLDGLEATREIRNLGFKMPIIALTGQALRDDAERSLQAGCDGHISKPVSKETLIEEIEHRVFH